MRLLSFGAAGLVVGTIALGACGSDNAGGGTTPPSGLSPDGGTSTGNDSGGSNPGTTPDIVKKTSESMTVNGQNRVYILKVPTTFDKTKSYPLVMDLHGSPGDAAGQSGDGFENTSGQTAIIVYPQALNQDSGAWSWDQASVAKDNQDIAMLEALPAELTKKGYTIDTTKVFGYGYSGGAFFLQVYQCLGAKALRAIASSAGGAPEFLVGPLGTSGPNDCVTCPGTPVPELIMFGKNDGGDDGGGGNYQALCQQQLSGCSQNLTATTPTPCQTYDGCPADKPLEYCLIPGVGHENWSQAITTSWGFFKTYL